MLPLTKFSEILREYQRQMNDDFEELITASDLLGNRPNYLVADEKGQFLVQVSGTAEECIDAIEGHLVRLKRIKKQSN